MTKKLLLSVLLSFCLVAVSAQQKKIYFEADLLEYDEDLRDGAEQYTGHVVFRHGNTVGYCDTALHFRDRNQLHAFGHRVSIIVNDSVTLFGDFLIYDGNARTVSISRNVILRDKEAALYTDSLIYDMDGDLGYYLTGGRMVSDSNTLTSRVGYYNTKTNMADLFDSVHLVNETYIGDSRSASYNTHTEIVYFTSRTHLFSTENQFFTDKGWYDTKGKQLLLDGNAELHNEAQSLFGDSLFYDDNINFGQGWNNVCLMDTVKDYIVKGNYMEYQDKSYAMVTDSMLLILIDGGDSLYLHSDTLRVLFDTAQSPQHFFAYNKVKFYRYDMQGACDSLVYHVEDSAITMYFNPVVWSEANQLTADTIRFKILDSVNMSMELCRSAFIASSVYDDETEFNQIKGLNIVGNIQDKKLTRVDVIGNAESLYYIQEEDSSLVGINSAATSEMRIFFEDNEIQSITFFNEPDGKLYPDAELDAKDRQLKDFRWLSLYRPATRHEVFTMPVERSATQTNTDDGFPSANEKTDNP